MKQSLSIIAAAIVLSAFGAAHAAPQVSGGTGPNNDSVQVSARAQAPAQASYDMSSQEFMDYANSYKLSTGRVIQFSASSSGYFTEVKGHVREIFPVAPGTFVTRNGARIEFSNDGSTVTISGAERLPILGVLPVGSVLTAQR